MEYRIERAARRVGWVSLIVFVLSLIASVVGILDRSIFKASTEEQRLGFPPTLANLPLLSTASCGWMHTVWGAFTKMRNLGIVALGAALGGCASSASDIAPSYVSPVAYQSYTCQQLALEAQGISTRAANILQ